MKKGPGKGEGERGILSPLPSPPFIPLIGSRPNFPDELGGGGGGGPFLSPTLALALALCDDREL